MDRTFWRQALVAGGTGGAVFGLWSSCSYGLGGRGWWHPVNLVAHTFWRGAPVGDRFDPRAMLLGAVAFLVMGLVVLVPYALLAHGAGLAGPLLVAGAAAYANIVWVIGDYLVWPSIDRVAAHGFSPGVAWVAHLVAGLVAGSLLALPVPVPAHRPPATARQS